MFSQDDFSLRLWARILLFSSTFVRFLFSALSWGLRDVAAFYPPEGLRGLLEPNPVLLMGEGQGTPWMSCQLIAGPLLMAVAAPQGANCTSGAILGFSILLKDTSACNSVPPQRPSDHWFTSSTHWATATTKLTGPGIPRRSPIQALTRPNPA